MTTKDKHLTPKGLSYAKELENHRQWLLAYFMELSTEKKHTDTSELLLRNQRIKELEQKLGWDLSARKPSFQFIEVDAIEEDDFIKEEPEDDTEGGKYTLLDSADPKVQKYWKDSEAVEIKNIDGNWVTRNANLIGRNLLLTVKSRVRTDYIDKEGKPKRGGLVGMVSKIQHTIDEDSSVYAKITAFSDDDSVSYKANLFGAVYPCRFAFYVDPDDLAKLRGQS